MKAGVYVWSLPMHKSGILPEVMNNMKKRKDWWMSRESYLWISMNFSSREIIMINATIKDGKNYREVNMSIDKDDVTVRAHLCSCPQHGKDTLSCEHCTAVLIKLNEEHEKKQKETDAHTAVQQHDSYAISLMNAYEEQIIYSSLAMNLKQAVHIEPVLEIRQRTILALTLKVGNAKRYIVKDIAQFLDDIRHNV